MQQPNLRDLLMLFDMMGQVTNDLYGPSISLTSETVDDDSAIIQFTTSEPANCQIEYTPSGGSPTTTALEGTFTTSHSITLPSLAAHTAYTYTIKAFDGSGNLGTLADSFTTEYAPPTFVNASAGETSGNSPTMTIARPVNTNPGDVLLAIIQCGSGSSSDITPPVGWTQLVEDFIGTTVRFWVGYHYWASGENNYQWGFTPDRNGHGIILAFRGCHPSSPILESGHNLDSTPAVDGITCPSVSATALNQRHVVMVANYNGSSGPTFTPPAGFTEHEDNNDGTDRGAAGASRVVPATGAQGTKVYDSSIGGDAIGFAAILVPPTLS